SRQEAFGRAALEALLLERPLVAAATGGLLEIVAEGEGGLLYPPGRWWELAERLQRLAADPALRARLARRGNALARARFAHAGYAGRILELCESLVAAGPDPNRLRAPRRARSTV